MSSRQPKFTKDRWQLSYLEHNYWVHKADQPKSIIARIGGMQACAITTEEHAANAYLLAHANKMYNKLEQTVQLLTGLPEHESLRTDILLLLRKARGPL